MCANNGVNSYRRRQSGLSLVELVMFIIIVSVGVAGILSVMNVTTQSSADPMLRKQALSIAESLLEEIQLQPFTYCDPTDANAATANSAADCASIPEVSGPEGSQSRYSISDPFNNVNDYAGFSMAGIRGLDNAVIAGLENYAATVSITNAAVGTVPSDASLRIDVRVTYGATVDLTVTGYRMRYAPNAGP
jgi:MSHA pilin protein MshD